MSDLKAKGEHRDCAVISLQLTTGKSYDECWEACRRHGRRARCGTHTHTLKAAARELGFYLKIKYIRPYGKAKRYTMKTVSDGLLGGRPYILHSAGHFAPFVDGKVRDWSANTNCRVKYVYEVQPRIRVAK